MKRWRVAFEKGLGGGVLRPGALRGLHLALSAGPNAGGPKEV